MNNRERIVDRYSGLIVQVLQEWGFIKGSSEYDRQFASIKDWLEQFEPNEIPLAIKVMQNIQFYDEKRIRTLIHNLSNKLSAIFNDDFSNVSFFPLGNSTSSSGGLHLYYYRKELKLAESCFKLDDFKKYINSDINIVFFDDIIGSGKQANTFFANNLVNKTAKFYYVALFGFEKGIKYILENSDFHKVIVGKILSDQDMAFSEDSIIFDNNKCEIKKMCEKYGDILFPRHPLGYNNTQSLIVLPHTVPNNTLPIIWASNNNEGRNSDLIWTPLFKRDKPFIPKIKKKDSQTSTIIDENDLRIRTLEVFYKMGFDLCEEGKKGNIIISYKKENYLHRICVHYLFFDNIINKEVVIQILNFYEETAMPSLIILWVIPSLDERSKEFVNNFIKTHKVNIIIEERKSILFYISYPNDNYSILEGLKIKIINALPILTVNKNSDEYTSRIYCSDHYLVDRVEEREILTNSNYTIYYVIGLSSCGKTQLVKNVVKEYANKKYAIFWHTILVSENSVQYSTFLTAFGCFFLYQYNNDRLKLYIENYGCNISNELISLIFSLIKQYNLVLVIDDIHKCNYDNIALINIFTSLIKEKACRLYFIGWFNIFDNSIEINRNVRYVSLPGLSYQYLDQIIQNKIGQSRIDIAKEIVCKYSGLPGYAELVERSTKLQFLYSKNSYFGNFVNQLTRSEQVVLFMLGYISVPIDITHFSTINLANEVRHLSCKKMIREEGRYYSVHDTYKYFLLDYELNDDIFNEIIIGLNPLIDIDYRVSIDTIKICINKKKWNNAYDVFVKSFDLVIHNQAEVELLGYLQKIENSNLKNLSSWELLYRKIVLLERTKEYYLCISYINLIIDDLRDENTTYFIHCLYTYFRCLYFTNQYDEIINIYKDNGDFIFEFANRNIIAQILLTVGRVFYIRGYFDTSLAIYLLGYQYAYGNKSLEVKVIYRIGMIEYTKGLIHESIYAFSQLIKEEEYLTPKRKSYLYNKLARSYLAIGDIEKTKSNNAESLKIKRIYNDQRGILFCEKLQARIYCKENNFQDAIRELTNAYETADILSLHKEKLILNLMIIKINMNYNLDTKSMFNKLNECIDIAVSEKLFDKLNMIHQICSLYWPEYIEVINDKIVEVKSQIDIEADCIYNICKSRFSLQSSKWMISLLKRNCISKNLILLSGFTN